MLRGNSKFSLFSGLIGLLLMVGCMVQAQAQSRYKRIMPQQHAITLQLADLHVQPDLGRYEAPFRAGYDFVNGLFYSYQITAWDGLRAGFAYRRATFDGPADNQSIQEPFSASRRDLDFSLDYLRQFGLDDNRLYAGAGLLYRRGREENSAVRPGDLTNVVLEADYAYQAFGGRALLGFRHYFSSHLSLGMEATAFALVTSQTGANDPTLWPNSMLSGAEWGFTASALLAVHFGKMKKGCSCPKH